MLIKLPTLLAWLIALTLLAACSSPAGSGLTARDYLQQGYDLARRDLRELAILSYTRAIELDPNLVEAYFARGLNFQLTWQYDRAIVDLDRAIVLDPKLAEAYIERGFVYYKQGNYERAIVDYDQAIALDPHEAYYYYDRGRAYRYLGDLDRARIDFDKAIELDPQLSGAYAQRGYVHYARGDYSQAIADLNQAIALGLQDSEVYRYRGLAYAQLGENDKARADFWKSQELSPQQIQMLVSVVAGVVFLLIHDHYQNRRFDRAHARIMAYRQQGQWELALVEHDKLIEQLQTWPGTYLFRGNTHYARRDYDSAIADYNRAAALAPSSEITHHSLGLAYAMKNDNDRAISYFNQALALT